MEGIPSRATKDLLTSVEVNEREEAALQKAWAIAAPRPEYAKSKERLEYSYTFSTGEVLTATENEFGKVQIMIRRGEHVVLDFAEILPFCTTSYASPSGWPTHDGNWGFVAPFTVFVGDLRDPKSFALLLHEIGHIEEARRSQRKSNTRKQWIENTRLFSKGEEEEREKLVTEISQEERGAWAEGLALARRIRQEKGIDLLEAFENLEELQDYIYAGLLDYRLELGEGVARANAGAVKTIWEQAKKYVGLENENFGADEVSFLKKLFDKERLKRGVPASGPTRTA